MKGRFNPLLYAFLRCHFPFFFPSSSFIYQSLWKEGKHKHPLDLTRLNRILEDELSDSFWNPARILGCCGSRVGRRQCHKRRARCWGCERPAWSSAWLPLNGGSAREESGDPPTHPHPPPPPLSLYIQLATQQRLQTSSNPHNALFCSFSHCAQTEESHKR